MTVLSMVVNEKLVTGKLFANKINIVIIDEERVYNKIEEVKIIAVEFCFRLGGGSNFRLRVHMIPSLYLRDTGDRN